MNNVFLLSVIALTIAFAGCGQNNQAEPDAPRPEAYANAATMPEETPPSSAAVSFVDVTQQAGVDFIHQNGYSGHKYMPETMGSGGGFFDYDNDGDLDLFLVNARWFDDDHKNEAPSYCALYRNEGDWRFTDVTEAAGLKVSLYGMGCAMADVDADGDEDLMLTAAIDGQRFYRNNGDGTFTDATEEAGLTAPQWTDPEGREHNYWSTSAAFFDYDRDGWLDLIVCNYIQWSVENDIYTTRVGMGKSFTVPTLYKGLTPLLYKNENGRFRDVTHEAGVFNPDGKSLGVAVADYNQDGWLDFAIANDSVPNFLYINNARGGFSDSALAAGLAFDENGRARAGMGIDAAPALDGRWSIAIGNFSHEPISFYTKTDELFFVDKAGSARISRPSLLPLTFGLTFFDYDLDGWLDMAVANGHIEPDINKVETNVTFKQPPQLFHNQGGNHYEDATESAGPDFSSPMVARGLAYGDLDRDGDLDLLITACGERPRLLRNDMSAGAANFIRIRLQGGKTNPMAVGAEATLRAGGREIPRMIRTGSSYLSQSELTLTFGLGDAQAIEALSILWPDGSSQELSQEELASLKINEDNVVTKRIDVAM